MTGNAIRQARYAEKMRAQGKKKLTLWVTLEEERKIKALLKRCDEKREAVQ